MLQHVHRIDLSDTVSVLEAFEGILEGRHREPCVVRAVGTTHVEEQTFESETKVALVIETSGSSGVPKLVALSREALLSSIEATAHAVGGHGQWLSALPTQYIAGAQACLRSLYIGIEPVFFSRHSFTAERFLQSASHLNPGYKHFVSFVPEQLRRIVDAIGEGGELGQDVLRCAQQFHAILVGGQATAHSLQIRAREMGLALVTTYGASETAGGCIYDGVPLEGVEVRLGGDHLEIGGATLAAGYIKDGQLAQNSFVVETCNGQEKRWWQSNDLAHIGDGCVQVLGRSDNVMISGGEKVSLDALERALHGYRGFENAIVVDVPDPQWGQRAVALSQDITQDSAQWRKMPHDIRQSLVQQLGRAADISSSLTVPEFLFLSTGKIDRVQMRKLVLTFLS